MVFLDGHHVADILDHAQQRAVAAAIRADGAQLAVADVMANAAIPHVTLHRGDGIGKRGHVSIGLLEQMKDKAQGCLAPNTGQLGKLAYRLVQQQ